MSWINHWLKAHVAAISAALALVVADLNANGGLSLNDWAGVAGAAIAAGAAVAVVPNGPKPAVAKK